MINYHQKTFKSISNTDNGEVGDQTIFYYQQQGNVCFTHITILQVVKLLYN
jgi:hypothetical protein